ncbi:hypothetical protein ACWDR0_24485 [Streptomyces sp. NPDC003691]
MNRVRVPRDVAELFAEAVGERSWNGPVRHAVGGRDGNGSWAQASAIGACALLVGGVTTWGMLHALDDLDGRLMLGLGFGYLITLIIGLAAVAHRPGPQRPGVWIQLYDEGLAHYRQGARGPTVLAWGQIERAVHHVTRVEDSYGREIRRVHSLSVTALSGAVRPADRGTVTLPPGFPDAEVLARYVTGRTR